MRLQALKRLGYTNVPCIVIPQDTPVDKLRNYIIKDNGEFGDWDYQALLDNWDCQELQDWAIDIPEFEVSQEEKKRPGWNAGKDSKESLCDMKENIALHTRKDFAFVSCFKQTEQGYPLSQIKADTSNIQVFADIALFVIRHVIGMKQKADWAILTTPKRRHKEMNFAEQVTIAIASSLGIPFYQDAITAKTRQRINPQFTLQADIKEHNVIVFDDILTTGATLAAVNDLLCDKNCLFVVGINNN